MNSTIESLDTTFLQALISSDIRIVLFDIDGTLMQGRLIADLLSDVLKEFGLPQYDAEPLLGTENLFKSGTISELFSIDSQTEDRVIRRYEELFFSCPTRTFERAVYADVHVAMDTLYRSNFIIGIFSLRKWPLAVHQIRQARLARFIYKKSMIPNGAGLKITGSGFAPHVELSPCAEKEYQLRLHIKDQPDRIEETLVIGDSLETDIEAANILGLRNVLIARRQV